MSRLTTLNTASENIKFSAAKQPVICSVKHEPRGKPDVINGSALTYSWQSVAWQDGALVKHICQGKPFAVAQYENGHRKAENFWRSNLLALDYDHLTPDEYTTLLQNPFIRKHAFAVIRTFSSTPDARRVRVLFISDAIITDLAAEYNAVMRWLVAHAPAGADTAATDAARAFYGSKPGTKPSLYKPDNVLALAPIRAEIARQEAERASKRNRKASFDGDMPGDFFSAIEQALGVTKYDNNGFSNAVPCPVKHHEHDDAKPAAHWRGEKHIVHCFKCGADYLAVKVGEALGIAPGDFRQDLGHISKPEISPKNPDSEQLPRYFRQGVPDKLRAAFQKAGKNAGVVYDLVTEMIIFGQISEYDEIAVKTLLGNPRGVKQHRIRSGLNQLYELGFLPREKEARGRGNPEYVYTLRPLPEALPVFAGEYAIRTGEDTTTRAKLFYERHAPDPETGETVRIIPDTINSNFGLDQDAIEDHNERRQSLYVEYQEARQEAENLAS